jgi:hypothetical protein
MADRAGARNARQSTNEVLPGEQVSVDTRAPHGVKKHAGDTVSPGPIRRDYDGHAADTPSQSTDADGYASIENLGGDAGSSASVIGLGKRAIPKT